jgi:hypothetical protein
MSAAGGGYCEKNIQASELDATEAVTIGSGGAAPPAGSGGSVGGTTSFGSHCSATGGAGGSALGPANGAIYGSIIVGGVGVGGDINIAGESPARVIIVCSSNLYSYSISGGSSVLGFGGTYSELGGKYGGGAGGHMLGVSSVATVGKAGGDGICIVEEYE